MSPYPNLTSLPFHTIESGILIDIVLALVSSPNELSIVDKNYIFHVLGPGGMPKGPLWDGRRLSPNRVQIPSAISIRDLELHHQLRKPWNKAFSSGPLSDYDQILVSSAGELLRHLEDTCSASPDKIAHIDISKWISYFSFDFMGALVFGENFDVMKFRDQNQLIDKLNSAMRLIALVQHAPWIGGVIRLIQFGRKESHPLGEFTLRLAQRRAAQVSKQNDFFYHLLQAIDPEQQTSPLPYLVANVSVITVAGSDTASSAMTNAIYYLLCNPLYFSRLQEEIDRSSPLSEVNAIDLKILATLPLLNAIINETLRLQPPVPSGLQRAPAEKSGAKRLPSMQNSAVLIPPYVYHRDPRYFFPNPNIFWPERWLPDLKYEGEFRLDRSAFLPFSSGPANCVGKALALQELRVIVSLMKFLRIEWVLSKEPGIFNPNRMPPTAYVIGLG
ncbi:hypothetical protein Clacol_001839 [Clathrus columnatus]|uniref:Cytochrome P450 n=1 Tax=Clathrus columnatus TaxID=1419009 RepID=A0AAV5A082_9AGAM|nr:hypothetical protein Clacol_001839 [Clathrus columnatus]